MREQTEKERGDIEEEEGQQGPKETRSYFPLPTSLSLEMSPGLGGDSADPQHLLESLGEPFFMGGVDFPYPQQASSG